jgi:DNA-binding NarL/FixJ family response regulator
MGGIRGGMPRVVSSPSFHWDSGLIMNISAVLGRAVRIAIVEDDAVLRDHLASSLQKVEGFVLAAVATSLAQGLKIDLEDVDILLVDLQLPDGSGTTLISEARVRGHHALKIIVISVFGDVGNVVRAIEAGADGYLLKGAEIDQAEKAIRTVLAGGAPISPAVASHILTRLRTLQPHPDAAPNAPSGLTEREKDVLTDLAKGYTYKEVAKKLGISHHTVADHVKAIYRKLSVRSRSQAVFEAMQTGLIAMKD